MTEIKTFTGSHNLYADIGTRGKEVLSISMMYLLHPVLGTGCLLTRFVVRQEDDEFKSFTTFKPRELAEFKTSAGEKFHGMRLNKLAIPVFQPGPPQAVFQQFCEKFLVWEVVADWVEGRCKENGFTLNGDVKELQTLLRSMVAGDLEAPNDENYKLVLDFPSIDGKKQKQSEQED